MKKNNFMVALIMFVFFVISFLTNILGPLIPDIIKDFEVSKAMAAFLPFSFFVAYGVFSIPAGLMIEKYSEKKIMVSAFAVAFAGALLFSVYPSFPVAMLSLFLIGTGMAMLQVAINPLLRVSGGEEHFAFNSVLGQLAFGAASFLSPQLFSYLVLNLEKYTETGEADGLIRTMSGLVPAGLPWVSLYWIFALIALVMVVIMLVVKFPAVKLNDDEKAGALSKHAELFKNRTVILFFFGILAYVGTEQGVANWTSQFLYEYHGFDPRVEGADSISLFWGLLTVGCFLGLVLLKFFDSKLVLKWFTAAAIISLTAGLFGPAKISLWAFPMVGFFASVMYSVIFSLALNSLKDNHGAFSGILCSGILGGAIVPLIVGALGDALGLKAGMAFIFIPLLYIFSIGFWAKPFINNKTFSLKRMLDK